ncbi:MAG TPA: DUF5916 domain-containing protein [Minicystis sp.]|nr:DUF5916 domain-containing protein [Minicystis sp.]
MLAPFLVTLLQAGAASPHLAATRVREPPKIDGRLDDAAWRAAPGSSAFTQKIPDGGRAPVEPTTVRVVYDADNLYVGVDCVEQKAPIVARLTRRDHPVEADSVEVDIGTRGDGKSAFMFAVNAAGVLSDAIRFNDTDYNQDWDENWEAEVARTPRGWSAEFKIPFRVLRYEERASMSFALQVRRYVSHRQETDEWAFIPRDAAGEVSRYGRLDGLVGVHAKSSIELRPFVVATVRHLDPSGEIPGDTTHYVTGRGYRFTPSAGLDMKWHVTPRFTLDATFNPDFGQVEADQVILNLTTFETFYPEKRPFFLEGVDTFSTPLPLLYTRRIGLAPELPTLREDAPYFEKYADLSQPVPIYGAAKLTGDLGAGFSMSELLAVTGREDVPATTATGGEVSRVAAPLTAFKLLRLKRDFGSDAYLGGVFMSTNRLEPAGAYPVLPRAPGAPAEQLCPLGEVTRPEDRCFHDAYVGGVDGKWRPGGGDWVATGQIVGSLMENGPDREQADGTIIRSGDAGPAAYLNVAKDGGKHWVGAVQYDFHGRRVDYNDLGYMQRQNQHHVDANLEYRTLEPWGVTNETHTWIEYYDRTNLDGLELGRGLQAGNYVKYKNFWSTYVGVHWRPTWYDDREVGDGTALEHAGLGGIEFGFGSDTRARVHGDAWVQTQFRQNGVLHQGQADLGVDILPQWDVMLSPQWFFTWGEPRYFGAQGDVYLFGKQRGQNLSVTLRSTYTFTPRLTLQAYAQLFVAAVHYDDPSSVPAPCFEATAACLARGGPFTRVVHLADLRPFSGLVETSPDFEEASLNMNLVLRWEYLLGSTLFLVYSHGQDTAVVTQFLRDPATFNLRLVAPRPASDAVIAKLEYWWG